MDTSIFMNKAQVPENRDLQNVLGEQLNLWMEIRQFVLNKYPKAKEEWNYPGKKYGWSFRIKDSKRTIIYLLPREGYFKVAFVFGNKAVKQILEENISEIIKTDLQNARVYAEGRGIQIEVKSIQFMGDIKKLVEIKLQN